MHDGHLLLGGDRGGESVADGLDESAVVDAGHRHLLVLSAPPSQLALDVSVMTSEVAEARRVDVDVVQLRQGRREVRADGGSECCGEVALGLCAVAQNSAVNKVHHVEGPFVHALVHAESERRRDRNAEGGESRDDGVFAHHVVRGGQHVRRRRASEGERLSGGVLHAEGQVAAPAGDQFVGDGGGGAHVLDEPRRHRRFVDADHFGGHRR